jgi:uncharacterized membrane protein
MKKQQNELSFVAKISGLKKLLFCLVVSIFVFTILSIFKIEIFSRIIVGWDTFSFSMIFLSWLLFFSTTSKDLCSVVEKQDDGLKTIFIIMLIAVCFSLFGTLVLMTQKSEYSANKIVHMIISLSPIFFSWILLHTMFTIRYAHLYHDHNKLHTGSNIGGLDFPAKIQPDYIDFAYFSFVIGMTFQVSDITISSPAIRRFVLMHSLISFVFNTIIVALTINTISNLSG